MESPSVEAILKLDVDERLRIVQLIWDSIAASPDDVPLTATERATIEELVAEDDADPADVVSWPEAKTMIRRSR